MGGDAFTAADIPVGYALEVARKNIGYALGEAEQAYMARLREREGSALEVCRATRDWSRLGDVLQRGVSVLCRRISCGIKLLGERRLCAVSEIYGCWFGCISVRSIL